LNILDKYILKEFLKFFIIVFVSFVVLYMIVDFFAKARMFLSNHATVMQMATYLLYSIPNIVSMVLPASILLATLMTYSSLSKFSEITAMKANGISLYRMALPSLFVAVFTSLFFFFFNELITPYSVRQTEQIIKVDVQKYYSQLFFKYNEIWYRNENTIYNFKYFDIDSLTMKGVSLYYMKPDFTLEKRISAKNAKWENGRWILDELMIITFDENNTPILKWDSQQTADIPEKPETFRSIQQEIENLGYFDLRKYVGKIASEGYDTTKYEVILAGKIAFPFVMVLMIFIGISFSLRSERGGGVMQSIAVGIVIGFSYWIVHALFMATGQSGRLPPFVAAWAANILFGIAGAFLFYRVRT